MKIIYIFEEKQKIYIYYQLYILIIITKNKRTIKVD